MSDRFLEPRKMIGVEGDMQDRVSVKSETLKTYLSGGERKSAGSCVFLIVLDNDLKK